MVLRLRAEGLSFAKIGAAMGVTRAAIAGRVRVLTERAPNATCIDCGAPRSRHSTARCRICCQKPRKRSVPADFADLAPTMTATELAAHYRCSTSKVTDWLRECGSSRAEASKFAGLPLPDNFAAIAPTMTLVELQIYYGRGQTVLRRWIAESGVRPRRRVSTFVSRGNRIPTAPRVSLDLSRAGGAAEFLRQFGPVYRCHELGRPDAKGKFWNRGGYVLTDDDIIQRAERLGYDADAWRKVA